MKRAFSSMLRCLQVLFCYRKKVVYIGGTNNVNLGDNAQRLLIRKWCKENYPKHKYIEITIGETFAQTCGTDHYFAFATISAVLFWALKIKQRKGDIFIGGSGYGLIDHAWNWLAYARLAIACRKTRIVIMPQTINFLNPWIGMIASEAYNSHPRLLLLCRDFVSLEKARKMFPKCHPIAYPDVVTSMIGTLQFSHSRNGVLFCVRDDGEAFYTRQELLALKERFGCRTESTDTTLQVAHSEMHRNPEKFISSFLQYISSFKLVITDRYHGTIFSLVAETPVVVISSTDHKLSSGVKWFPEDFAQYIKYADTLDKAYEIANEYLNVPDGTVKFRPYFKDKYWNVLKERIDEILPV